MKKYWLMKCEPSAYAIGDLERDGTTSWEGVRNYQARNFMREMSLGDGVLFYASNAEPSGVTGLAEVSRTAYPDKFAMQKGHKYFDEKSTPDDPIWSLVDIRFVATFPSIVSLDTLREAPGLENMVVLRKGSRLSIQPVTRSEFEIVKKLGQKQKAESRKRK
jgi:predicted RNA-binding protein with PUA-like domain